MNVAAPAAQPDPMEQAMEANCSGLLPARPQPRRIPKGVPLRPAQAMLREEVSSAGMFSRLFGKP